MRNPLKKANVMTKRKGEDGNKVKGKNKKNMACKDF